MAITTISAFKTHAGISGSAEDAFLTQILLQVEASLQRHIGRQIEAATVTEYYDGDGTNSLWLRRTPVQSITSVYQDEDARYASADSPFPASTLLTAGTDYALRVDQPTGGATASMCGRLYRIGTVWSRPFARRGDLLVSSPGDPIGNIKVTYVAGWSSVPADIVLAVHQMLGQIRMQRSAGGPLQSESLDYWSATYLTPDKIAQSLGSVEWLIKSYKQVVI